MTKFYQDKGIPVLEASRLAGHMMRTENYVLDILVLERLGLSKSQLGSPWKASLSSYVSFVIGAIVPILPYLVGLGSQAFIVSAVISAAALLVFGGAIALFSRRSILIGSIRMLLIGSAAAAVTFGIGRIIGVELLG